MLVILSLLSCLLAGDVIFADFEDPVWPRGWVASSDFPLGGPITLAQHSKDFSPTGFGGERFVTTYTKDADKGVLTSPQFDITHNYIRLSVGGGNYPDKAYVGLFVDGQRVAYSTGGGDGRFSKRIWNVTSFAGQVAEIRVVDNATADDGWWAFIEVDDIVFTDSHQINVSAKINLADASPFNKGVFQGWGTSLCWWANRIGYSAELTKQAGELFYSENGLHLNIGRYNVGGGDDPSHHHITRSDSAIPGYAAGFAADGSIIYDWSADVNQRLTAQALLAANADLYLEGFSNSPPYFMTVSGCSTGNTNSGKNNLRDEYYDQFAQYLADVSLHFKEMFKLPFQSFSPMNEPDTGYWGAFSNKQEGCHFDPGESESRMLIATREALDRVGLTDVTIAGTDETSIDTTVADIPRLSEPAKKILERIDTHAYGGSRRSELKALAISMEKNLWMSEHDGGGTAGMNAGNMGMAIDMANMILVDMVEFQPSAWITWDIIDEHKDSQFTTPNGDHPEANTSIDHNGGLWGVAIADHDAQTILLSQKYYAFGQFSRYIRPGDTIVGTTSDRLLAAYNRTTGAVKIVATNDMDAAYSYTFDLTDFDTVGPLAAAIRTSGAFVGGEHWEHVGTVAVVGKQFTYELPPNSITTFVIEA